MVCDLTDRLGPEILTVLEIEGQVLHRVRLHVKVPGWLLNLNALLISLVCQEFWRHPKRQMNRCDVNATSPLSQPITFNSEPVSWSICQYQNRPQFVQNVLFG